MTSFDNDSYWLPVFNYKCLNWIRYNWVSSVSINRKQSNQLTSIASSFIVLCQNTDIQSNKILFYTFNDDKITIAETSDSVIFIFPSFFLKIAMYHLIYLLMDFLFAVILVDVGILQNPCIIKLLSQIL